MSHGISFLRSDVDHLIAGTHCSTAWVGGCVETTFADETAASEDVVGFVGEICF